jgi:hypothetical protein
VDPETTNDAIAAMTKAGVSMVGSNAL